MSVYLRGEGSLEESLKLADKMENVLEQIRCETDALSEFADEYEGTLGPHQNTLKKSLEEIQAAIDQSIEPVREVRKKLVMIEKMYQDYNESIKKK